MGEVPAADTTEGGVVEAVYAGAKLVEVEEMEGEKVEEMAAEETAAEEVEEMAAEETAAEEVEEMAAEEVEEMAAEEVKEMAEEVKEMAEEMAAEEVAALEEMEAEEMEAEETEVGEEMEAVEEAEEVEEMDSVVDVVVVAVAKGTPKRHQCDQLEQVAFRLTLAYTTHYFCMIFVEVVVGSQMYWSTGHHHQSRIDLAKIRSLHWVKCHLSDSKTDLNGSSTL